MSKSVKRQRPIIFLPSLTDAVKVSPNTLAKHPTSDNVSDVRCEGVCGAVNFPVAALCDGGLFPSFCYDDSAWVFGWGSLKAWRENQPSEWEGLCDVCRWSVDHHAPGCPESGWANE